MSTRKLFLLIGFVGLLAACTTSAEETAVEEVRVTATAETATPSLQLIEFYSPL
jgi:hypothetical protein